MVRIQPRIYESSKTIIKTAKDKNIQKYLCDASELLLTAKRAELFELPNSLYNERGMEPTSRIAIIQPKDQHATTLAQFYIYATQSLGWFAELFSNRKKAIEWLNEI